MNIIKLPNSIHVHGDCIEYLPQIPDESIDFACFSPPFPQLYVYSADERDMGNCKDYNQFMQHFSFLPPELFRVTRQGRNVAIHCMDTPIMKGKEGFIGLRDFSGMIIQAMTGSGFIYHSRITIFKDPVVEMQRTKALGLLHKQIKKDSTMSRVGIPDYVLIFRKDGERTNPVKNKISVDTWQQYASPVWQFDNLDKEFEMIMPLLSKDAYERVPEEIRLKYATPVWMDIDYGNTLNAAAGRDERDEKHICPLQLDTIARLYTLYTNKGDTILTTFGGIGSEAYQAILMGRKAISIELKKSYFNIQIKNCKNAYLIKQQSTLFDELQTA